MEVLLREDVAILIMGLLSYVTIFYFTLRSSVFRNTIFRSFRRLFALSEKGRRD